MAPTGHRAQYAIPRHSRVGARDCRAVTKVLRSTSPGWAALQKKLDLTTSSPARDQLLTAQPCPPRPIATPPASDSASDSSSTGIAIRKIGRASCRERVSLSEV